MNIKKLVKVAVTVIIIVILGFLIKDNYYLLTNKIEYVYTKYLQGDIRQNLTDNKYRKKENYDYVKINENTTLKNKDDVKNMIYTYLDAGWDYYTVKCDADYLDCTNDIKEIVQNNTYLTDLSNFVHPFNTFDKINTTFAASGKVKLKKEPRYSDSQIDTLNKKVDEIYKENYDSSKNVSENIKIFHDYIVNHTKYDQSNTTGLSNVGSSSAYGVLIDGIGICSGYSDAMQLFLEKMNVKNYRISSSTHEWNLVYVEGAWRHLDLTWDDPIMSDGSDALKEDYFLIDTNTLLSKDDGEHNFDSSIYIEAK
ncbi:MAG: hypothetical protein ACI4UZ_00975 [Candidatus Aphodocola sp.]